MFLVEPDLISLYREVNLVSKFRKHWSLFFVCFLSYVALLAVRRQSYNLQPAFLEEFAVAIFTVVHLKIYSC